LYPFWCCFFVHYLAEFFIYIFRILYYSSCKSRIYFPLLISASHLARFSYITKKKMEISPAQHPYPNPFPNPFPKVADWSRVWLHRVSVMYIHIWQPSLLEEASLAPQRQNPCLRFFGFFLIYLFFFGVQDFQVDVPSRTAYAMINSESHFVAHPTTLSRTGSTWSATARCRTI
jgi:hypothetical protein